MHQSSLELQEHLPCIFEIFLASLLPDSASGALVTKATFSVLYKLAGYMKSNRQNQQIKLWSSSFALLCHAKAGGDSIRNRGHTNLLCCVWPTVGIYMRPPTSKEQRLQFQRLTVSIRNSSSCVVFVSVPYPPLCAWKNSLLISNWFLGCRFQAKPEQYGADATWNLNFRYFLYPHNMTQNSGTLNLNSSPRRHLSEVIQVLSES